MNLQWPFATKCYVWRHSANKVLPMWLEQSQPAYIKSIVWGQVVLMGNNEFKLVWKKHPESLGKTCSKQGEWFSRIDGLSTQLSQSFYFALTIR